jgi:predicted transcriptional regulator
VTSRKEPLGAIGIEAITALRRIGIEPRYLYGVAEAAIEAARSGLPFVIVCTEEDAPQLLAQVTGANLDYEILDLRES